MTLLSPQMRFSAFNYWAMLGFMVEGGGALLVGIAPDVPIAALGAMLIGAGHLIVSILLTSTILGLVPDELRGRVASIHNLASLGSRPFSAMSAGLVAGYGGPRLAMGVFAVFALLAGIVASVRVVTKRPPQIPGSGGGSKQGGAKL